MILGFGMFTVWKSANCTNRLMEELLLSFTRTHARTHARIHAWCIHVYITMYVCTCTYICTCIVCMHICWRNYTALQNLKVKYKCNGRGQSLHKQARKNPEGLRFDHGAIHSVSKCNRIQGHASSSNFPQLVPAYTIYINVAVAVTW